VCDASGRAGTIAIRPDARTERPSRELKFQHTLKDCIRRSRLGEKAGYRNAKKCQDVKAGNNVIPPSFCRAEASFERLSLASPSGTAKLRERALPSALRTQHVSFEHLTQSQVHWEPSMSIFGKIMGAIFGSKAEAAPAGGGAAAAPGSSPTAAPSTPAAPAQSVDVAAIVDQAVVAKKEKLEWRTSIVDLMKALDIDSSLAARKELAKELGYTGDTNDSASMNVWLHKQVMAKLAANGGKLPPEIKH
jgi:hypothetical protein